MNDFPKCPADLKQDTRYCAYCPHDDQCATQLSLDATVCKITRNCYDDALNEISLLKTSCPAPVLVPSSDKGGAPSLLFTEIHVDPDVPFCEFCELAQLDLDVSYSCQCKEVF